MARWEPILDEVMRERGSGLLAYARSLTGNAAEAHVLRAIPSVFNDRVRHRRTRNDARGVGVARRVRRRRTVRAVRVGGVSVVVVVVGALAVLAACAPEVSGHVGTGNTGAPACVEAHWPRVGPDGSIGSGAFLGLDLSMNLTLDGLTLSERDTDPPSEVTVPVDGGLLQGTSWQDEPLTLTMPSGNDVTVSLRWTDTEIAASAGYGPDEVLSFFSMQRYPSEAAESYPLRYHGIDEFGPSTNPLPTWILWDDYANAAALTFTLEDQEMFRVRLPDGSEQNFPLGSDALATFEWQGLSFQSQEQIADEMNFGIRLKVRIVPGDEVSAPLDATLTGPEFCIPDGRAAPTASAVPSVAPTPAPSPAPSPAT